MESLKYKSQIDLMKRENYDITNFEITLEQFKNPVGKNVSDEIVNLNQNKVESKNSSKKIDKKVKIKYFANRLIRKS